MGEGREWESFLARGTNVPTAAAFRTFMYLGCECPFLQPNPSEKKGRRLAVTAITQRHSRV